MSQRQDFLNEHPARVPITPNKDGAKELREEELSSVGAPDMDNIRYQVSVLDDFDIYWENSKLDLNTVFRPGLDTPFSPRERLTTWRWEVQHKTRLCLAKRKTRRTPLQQHQSLRDQHDALDC